jgi:hypothetical protein
MDSEKIISRMANATRCCGELTGTIMQNFKLRKSINALLCAGVLFGVSPTTYAEWIGNTDVNIQHDSNINNAELESDVNDATSLSADVSATDFFVLENDTIFNMTGKLQGESFDHYSGLNNIALGASLSLRKKWALGAYAPWVGASLSVTHLNYANNIRNGWRHQLALRSGKRVTERWNVQAELMAEQRDANPLTPDQPNLSGDVFSQTSQAMTLNAEYILSDSAFLSLGWVLRHGGIAATATESPKILAAANAAAQDPVLSFGPHVYAYRLNGTTHGLNADITFNLNTHSTLRVTMARLLTYANGGINYAKNVRMISWNHNF